MKGDFSEWDFDSHNNDIGVLHQQGRGLTDQDWNSATAINAMQRQVQANDVIGPDVAAVPADRKNSFLVTQAQANASEVEITLEPGRVWVDGFVIQVKEWPAIPQPATYLPPPFHSTSMDTSSITANVRDAVILEIWPEALNAFQNPAELLEPALGGVDTTERAKLFHRLRLLRLEDGDECGNLADKLEDDFSNKGKLTVSAETITVTGDCPVEAGGGYTGFEHYLIRVEIAEPQGGEARFKWSRFNGGLVGRGVKRAGEDRIDILANDQMINHCGVTGFYLEALMENAVTGLWEVVFSADATLSADSELVLAAITGTWPGGDGNEAFFRLWDGNEPVSGYPTGPDPVELAMGLRLQFDGSSSDLTKYTPGDFWAFKVRAAGAAGFDALREWPNSEAPQGIHYHRAPLAIITWNSAVPTTAIWPDDIHDCRRVFRPLTQMDTCCSFRVGDGMSSRGDFDNIQDAINALPPEGGEICVLKGIYPENLLITKSNVVIHGCGDATHLVADSSDPAIRIAGANQVTVKNMQVSADLEGIGVHITMLEVPPQHITLSSLSINAATRSGIQADSGRFIRLLDNRVSMQDVASAFHGIFIIADEVLIEHNLVQVLGKGRQLTRASAGRGGLQLGGTCDSVRVTDNQFLSGIGNGITLGTLMAIDQQTDDKRGPEGWIVGKDDPCDPCAPGSVIIRPRNPDGAEQPEYQSMGSLYDIRIERNRIEGFGLNGIGVVAFFDLEEEDEFISVVGLQILGNTITGCLLRNLQQIPDEMVDSSGYGAISLADVENAVINDNQLVDNGLSHLDPICGIYVLHGEGLDIFDNRILNNGRKTEQSTEDANQGPRAGIWVQFATAPKLIIQTLDRLYPRQNGVPAIRIHDNIVTQPLGRAVSLNALGPVSVLGNQMTSQGFIFDANAPSFFASTLFIFNLGISNELHLQQILFSGETMDDVPAGIPPGEEDDFYIISQPGLDSQRAFGYLGNGNVQCNDNQIMLDLTDQTGFQLGITSISIVSLDDVNFQDNQCDISFDLILDEIFLMQSLIFGWTVRVNGNRFKEGIIGSLFSAFTISLFANNTTHNQATHCIRAANFLNSANLSRTPNAILLDIFGLCDDDLQLGERVAGAFSREQATTTPQTRLKLLR